MRAIALYLLLAGCGSLSGQRLDSLVVQYEPTGGFFAHQVPVRLQAPGGDAIFYTLDGSTPTPRSRRYTGPIVLDETAVLRAVAYRDGKAGRRIGHTYFINEPRTQLPVVSLALAPSILFDPEQGIFMRGREAADSLWYLPGANFWTRQEFGAHIEIFESDGSCVYNSYSGLRLFGGMSRLFPQKSLALVARRRYGETRFRHAFFGPERPDRFKYLVLRNSGSDFGKTHFRDGLMTGLVAHWDLETQAYRPAQVYLNGTYWGIYNIREKVNRYFIDGYAEDLDKDSIDLLEHYLVRKRGSRRHYQDMLDFLDRYDLSVASNYQHLGTLMDIDNFLSYQVAQIYFDNQDAGGNIRYWRPQTPDGRWRWILFDTDWGFGLQDENAYRNNSLAFHTEANGPYWPNPPWSTFLLRKLLQNDDFRTAFLNRFLDHLNTSFAPPRVEHFIDSLYLQLLPEMPRHLERWRLNEADWHEEIEQLRRFARRRPEYLRAYLGEFFEAGSPRDVSLEVTGGGYVEVNSHLHVREEGLRGPYFANYPISLRAVPDYGHRFVGWEGVTGYAEERAQLISLLANKPYYLRAVFEPFTHHLQDQVMINEVCAKNGDTGDWIEIHNASDETVQLEGWILTDLGHEFIFPNVEILPNDYLVVCRDAERFRQVHPDAYNVVGGLGFGLNKRRETLALYAGLGAAVDSFSYEAPPLDTAFSLALLLPTLDNADRDNWELRLGNGTPCSPNPYYVESRIRGRQREWMGMGLAGGVFLLSLLLLRLRLRGTL